MKYNLKYIFISLLAIQSFLPSTQDQSNNLLKKIGLKLQNIFKNPKDNKKALLGISYGLFCVINNSIRCRTANDPKNINICKKNICIKKYKGKWNWINKFDIGYLTEYSYKYLFFSTSEIGEQNKPIINKQINNIVIKC